MKFKSKINLWLYLIYLLVPVMGSASVILFMLYGLFAIVFAVAVLVILPLNIIVIPVLLSTYYVLEENELYIKYGYRKLRIPYRNIYSVQPKRNLFAQTLGLSFDMLEIKYKNNYPDTIAISPKNKEEFIRQLEERRNK